MEVNGYFAASNSGRGFRNYYSEVFGSAEMIYVIKGGPGTGKSRFMKDTASEGERHGWSAGYYFCSSDPSSLDGVLLEKGGKSIALIDGTPPHAWEPSCPGAAEEIINLGEFWDSGRLRGQRAEIEALNKEKNVCWSRAYKWLSGCLDMCDIIRSVGAGYTDTETLRETAASMLAGIADGKAFRRRTAILGAVGMSGQARSGEFMRRAGVLYLIRDSHMTAHLLLDALVGEARRKRLSVIVSRDPVDADQTDGVFLEDSGIAVMTSDVTPEREYIPVFMSELLRELPPQTEAMLTHARRCREAMLSGATDALSEISTYHFRLEKIYASAMDFAAKEIFTERFCRKIFGE